MRGKAKNGIPGKRWSPRPAMCNLGVKWGSDIIYTSLDCTYLSDGFPGYWSCTRLRCQADFQADIHTLTRSFAAVLLQFITLADTHSSSANPTILTSQHQAELGKQVREVKQVGYFFHIILYAVEEFSHRTMHTSSWSVSKARE